MARFRTMTPDDEILNMARFKLSEAAHRLLALADRATDRDVRASLIEVSGMVLSQQRKLESKSRTVKRGMHLSDLEELRPPMQRAGRDTGATDPAATFQGASPEKSG